MSSELKPCKFCGAERGLYVLWKEDTPYVFCDNCKTSVSNERSNTEEQAIDVWNQRAERTCKNVWKDGTDWPYCSECGELKGPNLPYCPNCGAKVVE